PRHSLGNLRIQQSRPWFRPKLGLRRTDRATFAETHIVPLVMRDPCRPGSAARAIMPTSWRHAIARGQNPRRASFPALLGTLTPARTIECPASDARSGPTPRL